MLRLPIENYREEILKNIADNTVVVLRGPTGCGKTTKVPQFILDEHRKKRLFCNIVVAQPRRIAASSNAMRVCNERDWECGTIVGYQVEHSYFQIKIEANHIKKRLTLFCSFDFRLVPITNEIVLMIPEYCFVRLACWLRKS